jgi:WhiB family transcriptional regulator, redox-sensing transcriptional regulator
MWKPLDGSSVNPNNGGMALVRYRARQVSYTWTPQVPMPFGKGLKPCSQPARPDVMFPDPEDAAGIAEAKLICGLCDVRDRCLAEALRHPVGKDFGVWGGTTEAERRALRRARKANASSVWPRSACLVRCWAGPPPV